jgi:hypothetical protein
LPLARRSFASCTSLFALRLLLALCLFLFWLLLFWLFARLFAFYKRDMLFACYRRGMLFASLLEPLCLLQKRQRVLVFVEPWSRRALVFVRKGLCDWGASIFVKLGIPTCLSCSVISFCLFLHLPKGVQHLWRILSRSEATMLKAGMLQDQSQHDTCYLVWSFEKICLLAFKDVGRAVRAAYRSPFVRCKNTQRLGCAVPWNRAILRSLSAHRMSGPGWNRISNRKAVKVSCISFFQEVELRPSRWLSSEVSGAMEVRG